jgi:hypothetical protein
LAKPRAAQNSAKVNEAVSDDRSKGKSDIAIAVSFCAVADRSCLPRLIALRCNT